MTMENSTIWRCNRDFPVSFGCFRGVSYLCQDPIFDDKNPFAQLQASYPVQFQEGLVLKPGEKQGPWVG